VNNPNQNNMGYPGLANDPFPDIVGPPSSGSSGQ